MGFIAFISTGGSRRVFSDLNMFKPWNEFIISFKKISFMQTYGRCVHNPLPLSLCLAYVHLVIYQKSYCFISFDAMMAQWYLLQFYFWCASLLLPCMMSVDTFHKYSSPFVSADNTCISVLSNDTDLAPYDNTCRTYSGLVPVLLGLYLLVVNVLLLNLLIAIFR